MIMRTRTTRLLRTAAMVAASAAMVAALLVSPALAADDLLAPADSPVDTGGIPSDSDTGGSGVPGGLLDPAPPVSHTGAATYTMVTSPGGVAPHGLMADDGDSDVSTLTAILKDGAFLAVVIIDAATDPTEYRFNGAIPDGHIAKIESDGSVAIADAFGNPAGGWAQPWAIDAAGVAVATSFRIDGTTLVQTVDHAGATYPVLADPCGGWRKFFECVAAAGTVMGAAAACAGSVGAGCVATAAVAVGVVGAIVVDRIESSRPEPDRRPRPPSRRRPRGRCSRSGCG